MDTTDFNDVVTSCVLDMLLPGRGLARVRYVPSLTPVPEVEEGATEAMEGEVEELEWEQAPIEHVAWEDFRMGTGDEWACINWVGFRHALSRDELEDKFGEVGAKVPLNKAADDDIEREENADVKDLFKTAEVWEIWDKEERKVYFIAPDYKSAPLKTLDDPLKLTNFYPIPKPLYAIEDASSLVPIPLFEYYKEQADELDTVTRRINILVKGLKMRGIYDATISELSELMRGEDNDLIPAANVTALLERGGLEKAIWFMPIEQAAKVLQILQLQREATKQVIYEITGISDIVRGSTNANETATAQQIKSQWGNARLKRMQTNCATFIRDLIRLQAEIIGEQFQPETLASMTSLNFPTGEQKQQAMMQWQQQAAMAQQSGQQPPPQPELPPSWDEIIQVLRDDKMRTFKVDVETDSTVASSIESDMKGLSDTMNSLNQVIQSFLPAVQMGALPIEALKEMLLTVTRRAKMGNAVEDAIDKIKQPPPPPQEQQQPDNSAQVEQIRQQGEMQRHQAETQAKAQETQATWQYEREMEQFRQEAEDRREAMRLAKDQETRILLANITKQQAIEVAEINQQTTLQASQISAANQATQND